MKFIICTIYYSHNGRYGVSDHQSQHCLLNRLFRRDQRKHQSSASLAFMRGIHRWPVNSPHKGPLTRKMFPFDDVIMHWRRERFCLGPGISPISRTGNNGSYLKHNVRYGTSRYGPYPMLSPRRSLGFSATSLQGLTHRQNGRLFADNISSAFCWMKTVEFQIKCHWNMFLCVQLTIWQHWFR